MSEVVAQRACWCGHPTLEPYSEAYLVCKACGTLVSRASLQPRLYDEKYWTERQTSHHGLPDIQERARLDLPERCVHWLRRLLSVRLPPAKVLEVGCGHGGYLALLGWAGYDALGTELSSWTSRFAHETFDVRVFPGPVEQQSFAPGSFDVVVLHDVIEHLPDPLGTLARCAALLAPNGIFTIQTPEYVEHLGYDQLKQSNDLFLRHMEKNNDEHLYLFSRRSAGILFSRLGFSHLDFSSPVYTYDMAFVATRNPIATIDVAIASTVLTRTPIGRLVQALLDKDRESADRWWAIRRLENQQSPKEV